MFSKSSRPTAFPRCCALFLLAGPLLGGGFLPGVAAAVHGEGMLALPEPSQRAQVSQRIGLTDVTIRYHRPLVGGRKVWGGLVPFGQVWRAGANENTIIEFSDPVTIEGQMLARGTYGLHVLPTADAWTFIFSKNATSWGSYTYDQAEDALRVTVKPQPSEPAAEALVYAFDDLKPDSALVTLRWEKLAGGFRVAVDPQETTLPRLRDQFRGLAQYYWSPWNDAATYCVEHKLNLEEALRWADRSIGLEERFENLNTKATILAALGRAADAKVTQERALENANAVQLYSYGRQLQGKGQQAEAMEQFRAVAKRFPQHWISHLAQARLLSAAGDFPGAAKEVKAAISTAGSAMADGQKQQLLNVVDRLEKNQDINK